MSHDARFHDLRQDYQGPPLDESTAAPGPIEQFARWFDDVLAQEVPLANGMALATADATGQPSVRVVLLKSYDARGFTFFTSYASRKARELEDNPRAALLFWWTHLQRQVRLEGVVERAGADESDAYFATRPRASNLSAMASPQSQVVPGREWLEERVQALETSWRDRELVRPHDWGGYRLVPHRFEFWQGRPDRLHDRLCYSLASGGGWRLERLAP